MWNSKDNQSELVKENDIINREFCPNFKGFAGGMRGEAPEEYSAELFKDFILNNSAIFYRLLQYSKVYLNEHSCLPLSIFQHPHEKH